LTPERRDDPTGEGDPNEQEYRQECFTHAEVPANG
jgi:hypothetical protein